MIAIIHLFFITFCRYEWKLACLDGRCCELFSFAIHRKLIHQFYNILLQGWKISQCTSPDDMPGLGNTKIDEFLEDKQYSDDKYSRSKNNACNKYLVTVCLDHVYVRIIISKELNEIHHCIYTNTSWYIYILIFLHG